MVSKSKTINAQKATEFPLLWNWCKQIDTNTSTLLPSGVTGSGWIFKSKANESYCLYNRQQWTNGPTLCPIVWLPLAPQYVEKPLRETRGFVYVSKCLTFDLSGAYSVGPLVLTLFIDK